MSLSELYNSQSSQSDSQNPLTSSAAGRRRFSLFSAWMFPVVLVIAFAALFAFLFRDNLIPAVPVKVTRAILIADIQPKASESAPAVGADTKVPSSGNDTPPQTASIQEEAQGEDPGSLPDFSAEMLFQAAGWLEPDPLPIRATALTDGVVEKVHVLEGQRVSKGDLLAELISEDAELEYRATIRAREAIVAEHHMHLAEIPSVEAEAASFIDRKRAAEAQLAKLKDIEDRLKKLSSGTVSASELATATLAVQAQEAEIDSLKSLHRGALAKLKAIEVHSDVFEAKIAAAEVDEAEKKLALDRTKIHSPVDGFVLELKAAPGQKKMLGMDELDSATIAVLFEAGKLQARVDVPLAEARGLAPGQAAIVTTDFLPDTEFRGVVTRIVGSADLQRNTLQAKVRLIDPDPKLRPEMLCRVKFLDSVTGKSKAKDPDRSKEQTSTSTSPKTSVSGGRAIFVLEKALVKDSKGGASAWVIDSSGQHVEQREIVLGSMQRADYVAVAEGVLAGENLILPPHDKLSPGRRVRIVSNLD